ncbi:MULTISPECIES: tetratricopeptide repeat protein [Sphingomonas]|uniref:tetratricopeptide repeat protein n=1 Tax=Sphingomonas TaxID=13687 RepID=UPI0006F41DD8|nr:MULTISPECIES: tetratricopeptide repeat protein [unclassified Sphingomonas]KQN21569.1 thioredoxin [Sphingomonas sp. Leaf30]MBD8551394.1 tetratricopeptide repeat protein [Sphingomonas sp. CFBP 8764]MBD8640086.1 tetratricopeptide repeat protein [Sphingomonas sp. CFBP 13733]MBD8735282.1 tetratricopeptide repeat protein [Sphingomonas sp. CFBP 13706]
MSPAEKDAVEAFRRDVVEPSMTKLVIIDFWAEWCGPCKALGPTLEKVAADYADKGVVLAKVDTDKNQFIAAQFQIKSIPTVYAMYQGQLVADMTSARTDSQLRVILDQLLKQLPIEAEANTDAPDIEPLIAMGEEVLAEGDGERALGIFRQIADMAPEHPAVHAGFVRALVLTGQLDEAADWLANLDPAIAKDPAIHRAQAALALAQSAPPVADLSPLIAAVEAAPDDLAARFALANGQMAANDRDAAADSFLAIIAADRDWNESAARTQLLKLFEVVGLEDPWVSGQRRRLSAILFG